MRRRIYRIGFFITSLSILFSPIQLAAEEDDGVQGIHHDWEEVHRHQEEKLVDTFKKKIKTLVSHHYHDYHVYRTITVYTYKCNLHGEYKTKADISDKRVEKQPH
ncbi:hypothetical protein [Salinibacillus xinjiangensis]|uniref:Uncharacterized protein n=1 Tax=Salinibacillus xinjiangensis TaxID=1229268 RepID=A0A6G1X4R5_9BACI|nr:hypothetical protein [Salinibacillus xinjiangensis]MRG85870.1 hypothetical protein [Salinibacillus xinjiangensis]